MSITITIFISLGISIITNILSEVIKKACDKSSCHISIDVDKEESSSYKKDKK